jgi:hypothetical protein
MTLDEATTRLRALRGRLRSQGTQSTKQWKKALRHGDAEALTVLLSAVGVADTVKLPALFREKSE